MIEEERTCVYVDVSGEVARLFIYEYVGSEANNPCQVAKKNMIVALAIFFDTIM